MNIYKWFYMRTPFKRPFTFVLRDLWHKFEIVWIVGLVCLGVWLGHNFDWKVVTEIILIFSLGYITGHLFWGRDYIEGQK